MLALKAEETVIQGMWAASETGKDRETYFPLSLQKRIYPADILFLDQWDPCQNSDLQDCKI